MSDYKVRHDAWPVLVAISECGGDVYRIPPGDDGWHSRASLAAWLAPHLDLPTAVVQASFANLDKPGSFKLDTGRATGPDGTPVGGAPMTPADAYATGRITARSKVEWEARYAADPQNVGRTLASLAPVLATTGPTGPAPLSAAEELDIIEEGIFGVGHSEMSRERHYRRQDEEALAEYRAIEQAEREAAAETLTADEWRAIYGTEPPEGL